MTNQANINSLSDDELSVYKSLCITPDGIFTVGKCNGWIYGSKKETADLLNSLVHKGFAKRTHNEYVAVILK